MGLFDYVKFELPVFDQPAGTSYQTKDLACLMYQYVVDGKGNIYCEHWEHVWVEDDTAFFKGYPERVPGTYRREYLRNLTDYITFHGESETNDNIYRAHFVDGCLKDITCKTGDV